MRGNRQDSTVLVLLTSLCYLDLLLFTFSASLQSNLHSFENVSLLVLLFATTNFTSVH